MLAYPKSSFCARFHCNMLVKVSPLCSIENILIDDWGVGMIYKFCSLFMLHTSSARKLIRSQCTSAEEDKLPCLRKEKLVWQRVSQHFIPGDNVFQQLPQSRNCSSMLLGKKTTRWVTALFLLSLSFATRSHTPGI